MYVTDQIKMPLYKVLLIILFSRFTLMMAQKSKHVSAIIKRTLFTNLCRPSNIIIGWKIEHAKGCHTKR
jgi:hypothetical protein